MALAARTRSCRGIVPRLVAARLAVGVSRVRAALLPVDGIAPVGIPIPKRNRRPGRCEAQWLAARRNARPGAVGSPRGSLKPPESHSCEPGGNSPAVRLSPGSLSGRLGPEPRSGARGPLDCPLACGQPHTSRAKPGKEEVCPRAVDGGKRGAAGGSEGRRRSRRGVRVFAASNASSPPRS